MHKILLSPAYYVLAVTLGCSMASAQEPAADDTAAAREAITEDTATAREPRESAEQEAVLETCATVPGTTDFTVLDDRHVYMRTRGANHYLLTTEYCENMQKSFVRREVRLVPYGRRLCQNDGSYLDYIDAGRVRTCYIESVQRVANRAAARELAVGLSSAITVEPVELPPDEDSIDADADAAGAAQ